MRRVGRPRPSSSHRRPTRLLRIAACHAVLLALLGGPALAAQGKRPLPPWGTGESRGEDLVISLVTFGPGSQIIEWFGHSALVVSDRRLEQARLYNYGMFDFDPTMVVRFALGRLEFWVGDANVQGTLRFYKANDRAVRVQELALSPERRVELARALAENVLPANRDYLYDHYFDNCATRPRDVIDAAIGGALSEANQEPARLTLRGHTRRHTQHAASMSLLMDFLLNGDVDVPIRSWDEAFLPTELEAMISELHLPDGQGGERPLVGRAWTYATSSRAPAPDAPIDSTLPLLAFGVLWGGLGFGLGLWARRAEGHRAWRALGWHAFVTSLVLGLLGLLMFFFWIATNHTVAHHNENLFLASPLHLLALSSAFRLIRKGHGAVSARRWLPRLYLVTAALALLGVVAKLLPGFDQANGPFLALLLPLSAGLFVGHWLSGRSRESAGARQAPVASPPRAA